MDYYIGGQAVLIMLHIVLSSKYFLSDEYTFDQVEMTRHVVVWRRWKPIAPYFRTPFDLSLCQSDGIKLLK